MRIIVVCNYKLLIVLLHKIDVLFSVFHVLYLPKPFQGQFLFDSSRHNCRYADYSTGDGKKPQGWCHLITIERLSGTSQSNDVINLNETQTEDPETKARQRPPIGELLRKLRGTKTLRHVETDTGITNAYLSNIELGLKNPGLKTLTKLSRYYQVPIDHLLHVAGIEGAIPQPAERDSVMDIQRAFDFVVTDPNVAHYQKPADTPPLDMQKFVVQIYEHYTGRKLL